MRMQVEPEGECREAVFSAKGDSILIPPLSAVQVEYLHSGVYVPIYFGEVRRGGNGRDVYGEDYTLRGMSRRLEEVTLSPGFTTPEQAAHLTVRAIIQDVIASGQLGAPSLVQYVESLIPDLGFNCRAVKDAAQQNPAALLKQIAEDGAKFGVIVKWGVDPQRRFYARPAKSNTRNVTTESPAIRWQQPVAETPCTAVLWYVAKRSDGKWITHLSRSPDADLYGERVKAISLSGDIDPWAPAAGTYEVWSAGTDVDGAGWRVFSKDTPQPGFDPAVLTDDKARRSDPRIAFTTPRLFVVVRFVPDAGQRIERVVFAAESAYGGLNIGYANPGMTEYDPELSPLPFKLTGSEGAYVAGVTDAIADGQIPHIMNAGADPSRTSHQVDVYEFRPEVVDTDLLDGLAAFHYLSPAQEPADIQTSVFVPPVDLPGRVRVEGASVGTAYEQPLEAVEYRITSNGMQMGWMAGQSEDPAALAQASLIRKRDGQAVITALTSQA